MSRFGDWIKRQATDLLLPDFYLPVILPDTKLGDPLVHYDEIEQQGVVITASSLGPDGPLEIGIANSQVMHDDPNVPMSTVFASTSGFVTYELGDIMLRVWLKDYDDLVKAAGGLRVNRIVLGSLDPTSVENAMTEVVATLALAVLRESWIDAGGTGAFPQREVLESTLVQRFMGGTASIFVRRGTPIGDATIDSNDQVARFTLQTFFDPFGPDPALSVPAEDLIDNALTVKGLTKYAGHPLLKAISGPISVRFLSQFLIWNNVTFSYEPLANTQVTLLAGPPMPSGVADLIPSIPMGTAQTGLDGRIDLTVLALPSRSMINFRYQTSGQTYGNRLYSTDVETNAHKARLHVDSNFANAWQYKAKYEIYPRYQSFVDDLVAHRKDEAIGDDRGNASEQDLAVAVTAAKIVPDIFEPNLIFSQSDRLACIAAFESFYKRDVLPPKANTFNILVEGDSWLNYPLAFNDLFGQLDQMFWDRLRPGIAYNRIPIQHFGDRGDQMFLAVPGKTRQWDFTEDFLKEYQIDLIVCSAGGNDFAEPGIGNSTDLELFQPYFTDGYFDPFVAKLSLGTSDMALAEALMRRSFAALLQNHRWHAYLHNHAQLDEAAMTAILDPLLQAVGTFAQGSNVWPVPNLLAPFILQPIGDSVIANFPDDVLPNTPAANLLTTVFDWPLFTARYGDVTNYLKVLLTKADSLGIPVITHTYCYPLFNENPTSLLGYGRKDLAGPWFNNRFREANIASRVIEKIGLKTLLDGFVSAILNPLKAQFPLFDYVDVRRLNSSTDLWRDEMHLRAPGFRNLAEQVFSRVASNPKFSNYF
jgi:hypothetical protein